MATKNDTEKIIRQEIEVLEKNATERLNYCLNNVDAENFEEVMRDYRSMVAKIESKKSQIKFLNTSKKNFPLPVKAIPGIIV